MGSGCLVFLLQLQKVLPLQLPGRGLQQKRYQIQSPSSFAFLQFPKIVVVCSDPLLDLWDQADTLCDVSDPLRLLDACPRYLNFTWEGRLLLKVSKLLKDSNRSAALCYPALNIRRLHFIAPLPILERRSLAFRASRTSSHFGL